MSVRRTTRALPGSKYAYVDRWKICYASMKQNFSALFSSNQHLVPVTEAASSTKPDLHNSNFECYMMELDHY